MRDAAASRLLLAYSLPFSSVLYFFPTSILLNLGQSTGLGGISSDWSERKSSDFSMRHTKSQSHPQDTLHVSRFDKDHPYGTLERSKHSLQINWADRLLRPQLGKFFSRSCYKSRGRKKKLCFSPRPPLLLSSSLLFFLSEVCNQG